MNSTLEAICVSLDLISTTILTQWASEQTYCEAFGWTCPALTRHDLAGMASNLANRIRRLSPDDVSEDIINLIADVPKRLQHLVANTLPQLPSPSAAAAAPVYISAIDNLRLNLEPLLAPSWEVLQDTKAVPALLARRIRSMQAELDQIIPNKELLETQLKSINEANSAAESLPIDLQSLSEARTKVDKISTDSALLLSKVDENYKDIIRINSEIKSHNVEAEQLVKNCEEAYHITTNKGLAAAFDLRASNLSKSMWIWVLGLLVALSLGAWAGSHRIEQLTNALSDTEPKIGILWLQIILSLLSVGAPIWFAWLATKQIGQRFRLAEDYAFKASVAKAYEGYRKEAAKIDKSFEARLFSSALARLEEAPLRLVEHETHGSPWHELFSSKLRMEKPSQFINKVQKPSEEDLSSNVAAEDSKSKL